MYIVIGFLFLLLTVVVVIKFLPVVDQIVNIIFSEAVLLLQRLTIGICLLLRSFSEIVL